ncbi:hypothetical protein MUP37_00995 [Candidatus Bathyarchaeota archaeon]|nr:hypothetical protein [Candidatus Bathyarchaeota archaeon]
MALESEIINCAITTYGLVWAWGPKSNLFSLSSSARGFFTLLDDQIYYFNVGDVRWFKNRMLIRTAKHYEDYDGGSNGYVHLDKDFGAQLLKYLRVDELAKQTCTGQTALA